MVIYSKVKLGLSPEMNALACLTMLVAGCVVIFVGVVTNRAELRRMRAVPDG